MATLYAVEDDVIGRVGSTLNKQVTVTDDGSALDLTSYDVRMSIEFDRISGQSQVDLTEGSGITIDNAAGGLFSWKLTETQTALVSTWYPYTIKIEDGSDNEYPIVEGRILLLPQITA